MIWNGQNGKDKILVDNAGNIVPLVLEFNEETEMATLFISNEDNKCIQVPTAGNGWTALKTTIKIPGAHVIDKY
tara:strand:+ start:41840 stop:42061 length:222 start_codon:yes stop_codon:yes gene_type:complete